MVQQVEPDTLVAAYREQLLAHLDLFLGVGLLGLCLVVFLLAVIAVRKL